MRYGQFSRWLQRRRAAKPVILMYHRVARAPHDPWSLCVEPERFFDQLRWLKQARRVLSLSEFVSRNTRGSLPGNAVAITFDDGYRDNLEAAYPALAELNLSATLFVVSGAIGTSGGFWWDELAGLILTGPAADSHITIAGQTVTLRWGERPASPGWSATVPPPGPREAAYLALWRLLQRASEDVRQDAMATLRTRFPWDQRVLPRALDQAGLAALTAGKVFSLGGHSITHPALTTLSDENLRREIAESSEFCRTAGEEEPIGFAYPYGDVDERVWRAAASNGIDWGCTTCSAAVTPETDRLNLPRLAVGNWSVAELSAQVATIG